MDKGQERVLTAARTYAHALETSGRAQARIDHARPILINAANETSDGHLEINGWQITLDNWGDLTVTAPRFIDKDQLEFEFMSH